MNFLGEIISISVAFSWTMSALFFEVAGKRIGSLNVNIIRLFFALVLLGTMLFFTTGSPLPQHADASHALRGQTFLGDSGKKHGRAHGSHKRSHGARVGEDDAGLSRLYRRGQGG